MKPDWRISLFGNLLSQPTRNGIHKGVPYQGRGIPIIKMGEVYQNREINPVKRDLLDLTPSEIRKLSVQKDDLLFCRTSLVANGVGHCAIIKKLDQTTTFASNLIRARVDTNKAVPDYYRYYFSSQEGVEQLISIARGTSVTTITGPDISALYVPYPPISEQHAIAGILGDLDDKIELNRRMNATLESMVRAVFRQWFVKNEEVRDWEIGQIKGLGEIVTGKTPPTTDRENYNGVIPFITIPDMHGKMFVIVTGKTLSEKGVQTQLKKTLPPYSICVSCIATPGLVSMTIKPSQTNQQINSLIPSDKKSIFYCYFALREFGDEIRARGSGGSVLLNLNKGQFETMSILKPPTDLIHKFQEFAEPLLERLLANEKESRMLASLRDSLLPKLMRGEAIVKNMET